MIPNTKTVVRDYIYKNPENPERPRGEIWVEFPEYGLEVSIDLEVVINAQGLEILNADVWTAGDCEATCEFLFREEILLESWDREGIKSLTSLAYFTHLGRHLIS